ncbi:putative ABC transport system permease protein [Ekhidna lutea]|uniref:Putative ABC transport system permease protein n=1 Tax=Ekhidna lutea TaxID=447679 RepID=A0A239HUB6_EKHLU|nr:FtsX-like permease family protein [Ekhidna lutea]SNS84906.1 putative ABC transport system permease protein [Ekhidna lutea]
MENAFPPKWPGKLLRLFINKDYLEEIEGDLEEVFFDDVEHLSLKKAKLHYTLGVFKLFRLSLIKNLKWIYKIGLIITIMRTIKLAFRNLLKFKTHSGINLIGLSLGLAVGGLILLYVMDELAFDNFHEKGDRVYKVVTASEGGMETNAWPIGYKLRTEFPEVESVLYVKNFPSTAKLNHKDKRYDQTIFYASQEFFDLFTFDLTTKGNRENVLTAPYTVAITKSVEDTYFDGDALGKTLTLADTLDFEITGVIENPPSNSHIQFDVLVSFPTIEKLQWWSYTEGWGNFNARNYLLLKEGIDPSVFQVKIKNLYDENIGDWLDEMGVSFSTELIPLKDVYLNETYYNGFGPKGSKKRVNTVTWIAIFLLILACINYVNLSTARSSYRAKEVGMKKVVGSSRTSIVAQFMTESFLLTSIAFIVGLLLMYGSLPFFNNLMDKEYSVVSFLSLKFITGIVLLIIAVTIGSGFYPAWIISSLNPLHALSGKLGQTFQGLSLRKILITFQFFISSGLVIATFIVISQIDYMRTQDLGFEKEQVLIINATDAPSGSSRDVLRGQLQSISGVHAVSHTNALPGRPGWLGQWAYPEKEGGEQVDTEYMAIDENYAEVLGLQFLAGRNFDVERPSELEAGLIINETCVRAMGWNTPENAIGKEIVSPSQRPAGTVIGVVKDYHGLGLQDIIWPQAMDYRSYSYGKYFAIRYSSEQTYDLIKRIESAWDDVYGDYEFDYFFLDEDFDRQYREENQLAKVLTIFAVIILIVSSIGLFGLISFVALSRTKEVGIRKTMGASIGQIIVILSKEFMLLVLIGNLLVIPLVWHYGNEWLNDFAFHTSINPMIFAITMLITVLIAFITVSVQTYKTAKMNPVRALRYE